MKVSLGTQCVLTVGLISGACAARPDGDDVYADDGKADASRPKLTEGPISFEAFVQTVLRVTQMDRAKSYHYLGENHGKQCSFALWFTGLDQVDLDVRENTEEDNDVAMVHAQHKDKLSVTKSGDAEFDFQVNDPVCREVDDAIVSYVGDGADPTQIVSIKTTVRDTLCGQKTKPTLHERSCGNLHLAFTPSPANLTKVAKLMRAALGDRPEARRITPSRFGGCDLDLAENGNLGCSWDVSDDTGGDTGHVVFGVYKLDDGKPSKLLKTSTDDKR